MEIAKLYTRPEMLENRKKGKCSGDCLPIRALGGSVIRPCPDVKIRLTPSFVHVPSNISPGPVRQILNPFFGLLVQEMNGCVVKLYLLVPSLPLLSSSLKQPGY
jgi:hypothetical protein